MLTDQFSKVDEAESTWRWKCRVCGYVSSRTNRTRVACGCGNSGEWGAAIGRRLHAIGIQKRKGCKCKAREQFINRVGYYYYSFKYKARRLLQWLMKLQ